MKNVFDAFETLRNITGASKCSCSITGCEHDKAHDAIKTLEKHILENHAALEEFHQKHHDLLRIYGCEQVEHVESLERESALRGMWGDVCEVLKIYNKVQSRLPTREEAIAAIEKLREQRDECHRAKLTQYHVVPFEESAECRTRPWHSPHCYESTRTALDENACICGLTKLYKEAAQMRKNLEEVVPIVKALFEATYLFLNNKPATKNEWTAAETAQEQAAKWYERMMK